MAEVEFNVLLTGIIGSGKSKTGNFFMRKEAFPSEWSLKPVTTTPASCIGIVGGKCVKFIDTPGFLDPQSLSYAAEFKGLAKAMIDMPNGINAIGLVIDIRLRISKEDENLLNKLLSMAEMIPYTFIIFTHAKVLGNKNKDQQQKINKIIRDESKCPKVLQNVINNIKNRYMVLESGEQGEFVDPEYYDIKVQELLKIIQGIMDENKHPFSCVLNDIAEKLEECEKIEDQNKEKLVEALSNDLEKVKEDLSKQQKEDTKLFWMHLLCYIAGGVGIGIGIGAMETALEFSPTFAVGASEFLKFISKNPEVAKAFIEKVSRLLPRTDLTD